MRASGAGHKRREALRSTALAAGGLAFASGSPWLARALASGALRRPDSLPDPSRPAGEPTSALPFDHIVCLMQENHSFDNYFGMLPVRGQPRADGFTFAPGGTTPLNTNPLGKGVARVTHAPTPCQPYDVNQAWTPTHKEVDGGRMDGFANFVQGQMYYYDESDIPFYYSLAKTFTLGNRWFASAMAQTFPNRRFYLAGTAFGLVSTDIGSVGQDPPNGTIFDRLNHYGISWRNYFVDVPFTGVIESIPRSNLDKLASLAQFFVDCSTGALPAVSYVDPEFGALNQLGSALMGLPVPGIKNPSNFVAAQSQDEENPADIQLGESFCQQVIDAVIASPAWPRTLLIWTYDEHGGYYDHVPPPAAIPPDSIKPKLAPSDIQDGYDFYGVRVPAVVASPYSKPGGVTGVVHDHTSVLATIEAKWNLPACTYRDANATTVADFLDLSRPPAMLEPPMLTGSGSLLPGEQHCDTNDPKLQVLPASAALSVPQPKPKLTHVGRLIVAYHGAARGDHAVIVELRTSSGTLRNLELELIHGGRVLARAKVSHAGPHRERIVLRAAHRLSQGRYTLVVKRGSRTLVRRSVHVPR